MSRPILQRDDERQLVLQVPATGSAGFGMLALLVLLVVWWFFPDHRIAQGIFLIMGLVGFAGLLQVHRLALDLDARRWQYRDGWVWQGAAAEGTFDDLACVAIEENQALDGLAVTKLRSRLLFLEFDRFDVEGHEGRFPLGFALGPAVAPDRARHFADRLGVEFVDRVSDSPPTPASCRRATLPGD